MASGNKYCPVCEEYYPRNLDYFYADSRSLDKLMNICKFCKEKEKKLRRQAKSKNLEVNKETLNCLSNLNDTLVLISKMIEEKIKKDATRTITSTAQVSHCIGRKEAFNEVLEILTLLKK